VRVAGERSVQSEPGARDGTERSVSRHDGTHRVAARIHLARGESLASYAPACPRQHQAVEQVVGGERQAVDQTRALGLA